MTNKIYPLHCKCRIYDTYSHHAGEICIHCGTRLKEGIPHIRQIERQMAEEKAIDRIMVT